MKRKAAQKHFLVVVGIVSISIVCSMALTRRANATSSTYPPRMKPERLINIKQSGTATYNPTVIKTKDFNHDGVKDILTGNSRQSGSTFSCSVSLVLGNSDGTFGTPTETLVDSGVTLGNTIFELVVGDLDGDTHLDAVVASGNRPHPTVLRGDGTGAFTTIQLTGMGNLGLSSVAFGDFWQGSGPLDIVGVLGGSELRFYEGTFVGTTPVWTYKSPATVSDLFGGGRIAVDYLNSDSFPDMVTGTSTQLRIYFGAANTTEGLLVFNQYSGSPLSVKAPNSIAITNVEAVSSDTDMDIIVSDDTPNANKVSVVRNVGSSGSPNYQVDDYSLAGADSTRNPALGYINGDGILDLLTPARVNAVGTTTVRFGVPDSNGSPTGTFGDRFDVVDNIETNSINAVAVEDMTGDGLSDLLIAPDSSTNAIFRINGLVPKVDFDGDNKTDYVLFRPDMSAYWWILNSYNGSTTTVNFGATGDKPVPGDYDGDGKTDIAVWRPSTGVWYKIQSSDNAFSYVSFGLSSDVPVPGDYDGDGKTDIAVWRPSTGVWYKLQSTDGFAYIGYGQSGDVPVPGDYDGDGTIDVAVFRPGNSTWYIHKSSNGSDTSYTWGNSTDTPVQGDYDGDRKTDVAVWRADGTNGTWYIRLSSSSEQATYQVGTNTDRPQPDDFDGDGKTDAAAWRGSDGRWVVRRSSAPTPELTTYWGQSGDVPASSIYTVP